jgi:hypothetical protein
MHLSILDLRPNLIQGASLYTYTPPSSRSYGAGFRAWIFSLAYTPVGQFQIGDASEMIGVVGDQGQVVGKVMVLIFRGSCR